MKIVYRTQTVGKVEVFYRQAGIKQRASSAASRARGARVRARSTRRSVNPTLA